RPVRGRIPGHRPRRRCAAEEPEGSHGMTVARHNVEHAATPIHDDLIRKGHKALRKEIDRARQERCQPYHAYPPVPPDGSGDAFDDWQRCSIRHRALIEAGLIITTATEED